MIHVTLPWPDKDLSPNKRSHWMARARLAKNYRRTCGYLTVQQVGGNCAGDAYLVAPFIHVSLKFVPGDRRHRDLDNLVASMKSGLDGIADGLYVNDRKFRLACEIAEPEREACVRVEIQTADEYTQRQANTSAPDAICGSNRA